MRSVAVGEISEQIRGVSYGKGDATSTPADGYAPVLRAGNITEFGVTFEDLIYVPKRFVSEKQLLRSGDVLIAASSGSLDVVGKAAPVLYDYEGAFGAFCKVLRPRKSHVEPSYFAHYFKTPEYRRKVSSLAAGANINNLKNEHLDELLIPLPPLEEQRRIAAILDKADALRTKRREALSQLDRLAQSIFVDIFGDPGANVKRWPLVALGTLIREKPNNGIFRKNEEYGDGLPVAWVEDLFRGQSLDLSSSRRLSASPEEVQKFGLRQGDILFCRSSLKLAGLGYNSVYLGSDAAALFECHLIRISPRHDLVDSEFLNFLLRIPSQRQRLFRFAKTVTMSTIDQEGIKSIEVPIPPLKLQKYFVAQLHALQLSGSRMSAAIEPLNRLFVSLQHRAFQGEL